MMDGFVASGRRCEEEGRQKDLMDMYAGQLRL
jgi:hypothetical protein